MKINEPIPVFSLKLGSWPVWSAKERHTYVHLHGRWLPTETLYLQESIREKDHEPSVDQRNQK